MDSKRGYFFGFSTWKHPFIKPFVPELDEIHFINPFLGKKHLQKALKRGLRKNDRIYIWGRKNFLELETYAYEHDIEIYRVEDGFIRSVGLGSDLTQPYSLVIDSRGIYFDPTVQSDLEFLLHTHSFESNELNRASNIRKEIVEKKLSKYNTFEEKKLQFPLEKRIVFVPGQVEDDASIRYGGQGMSNLELLEKCRVNCPNDYIVFKPHPDVLSGNRVGHVEEKDALKYCDTIVTEVGLDSVLSLCDEVHTITSLVGFEALMRQKKVYTYGLPFYAGWGLTEDEQVCARRNRAVSLDMLVAATLLLYPIYIDIHSKKICEAEETLAGIESERKKLAASPWLVRQMRVRNYMSRKAQQFLRFFKS